ncbi:MAG: helix-turn-helix transcriptional regulator [Rhodocyclaceae bacterium]|jgi:transcriptional regulator with XRE-family HTH domain|nr:helix-turn-helix transcriptional regulator [Rhodocyclaceae bacterium]
MIKQQQDFTLVFGQRLRKRRQELGLSQEALGVAIGIDESCSRTRISRYETGKSEPALAIGQLLAGVLGVPVGYFYCDDDLEAEALLIIHAVNADQKRRIVETLRGCLPDAS